MDKIRKLPLQNDRGGVRNRVETFACDPKPDRSPCRMRTDVASTTDTHSREFYELGDESAACGKLLGYYSLSLLRQHSCDNQVLSRSASCSPPQFARVYHQPPPRSKRSDGHRGHSPCGSETWELLPPLRQSSVTGRRASSEFASCVYCPTPKESYLALNLHRSSICKMALWPIRGFRRATAGLGSPLYEQPCMMNLRPINRARETLVCTHLLSAGLCYVTSHILHARFARMSSEHVSLLSIGYLTANQGLPRTRILQTVVV